MNNLRHYIYIALLTTVFLLTSCASPPDPAEAYQGESPQKIFKAGEDALYSKNYADAIKRFEALDIQYPFGHDTETAQLHIIYAYYQTDEFVSAEAAADHFIHTYPSSPHVDYAYFMRGLSHYYQNLGVLERLFAVDYATRDLSQLKNSYNDFAQLIRYFPDSRYVPAAHQYMIYLRNVIAKHQYEVAQYYYGRKAYVAAVNRASDVVKHYQGAPIVPKALVLMQKSYVALNLAGPARTVQQIIDYNHLAS